MTNRSAQELPGKGSSKIIYAIALALIVSGYSYVSLPLWLYGTGDLPDTKAAAISPSDTSDTFNIEESKHLSLPRLNISLNILPGSYSKEAKSWTLDEQHAFYMVGAKSPLIYGHDVDSVFRNLAALKPGDVLLVSDSNQVTYRFVYTYDKIADPNDKTVLSENTGQLRLFTCTGLFYQKRRIMYFTYLDQLPHKANGLNGR